MGLLPNVIPPPALRRYILPGPIALQPGAAIASDHHPHDPSLDGAGAEQAFLNGEAGIFLNGTWAVDSYDALAAGSSPALRNYEAAGFPTLYGTAGVRVDLHTWLIPADETRTEEELYAAMDFRAFLHANGV